MIQSDSKSYTMLTCMQLQASVGWTVANIQAVMSRKKQKEK